MVAPPKDSVVAVEREPADLASAFKSAGFAALVMLGLSIPIVALRTEQNMANELILIARPQYVFVACAGVFLSRFILVLFSSNVARFALILGCLTLLGGIARAFGAALDSFALIVFIVGVALIALGLYWERRHLALAALPAAAKA